MDLHPEDLIEREMCGDLSPVERERLEEHARQCAVCKLERLARADFRRDAEGGPDAEVVQRLLAAVAAPLAINGVSRIVSRPRMRHMRFVLVAAAVISMTGLAAAARWSGTLARPEAIISTAYAPVISMPRPVEHPVDRPAVVREQAGDRQALSLSTAGAPMLVSPVVADADLRALPRVAVPAIVVRAAVPPVLSPPPDAAETAHVASAPVEESAPNAPALFGRANAAMEMGDHAHAGELYRRLLDVFPSSPEARASLPMFGRMLLDDGNAASALRCFEDSLRLGRLALREDVMLGRALALQRLSRPDDETNAWSSLLDVYPSSVYAERARRRLAELGRR